MKALEFKARMKNNTIRVPDNLTGELSGEKNFRVIVLLEELENKEEDEFIALAQEQFLNGYSESDSIYDNYEWIFH